MTRTVFALCLVVVAGCCGAFGQACSQQPSFPDTWTARWITHPTAPILEAGLFHFRKSIRLAAKPEHYFVAVSADNRFLLYVNGQRVGEGPSHADLPHWRYECFDLAPSLHAGENLIAAAVWNFGIYGPLAQMGDRTAFLVQGASAAEHDITTDESWDVEQEPALSFIQREAKGFNFYWAADAGERFRASIADWEWKQAGNAKASSWTHASGAMREMIQTAAPVAALRGQRSLNRWELVADPLPPMQFTPDPVGKVVRTSAPELSVFPAKPVTIAPHTVATILLDRGIVTSGYPSLRFSGGSGATITLGYTEALYDSQNHRGNRNEIGDRQVRGLADEVLPDGGAHREFMPLYFRTWRYLEVKVQTADRPLTLDGLEAFFSAYPFQQRASFQSSDPELEKIWEICWRTARLGAHDTYMDTPFWEQLQYIEDTRLQALISYSVAGDDRLAAQALHAFDDSRIPEGITQSRYPSRLPQFIPNFSLSYVDMVHDYWMYRPDDRLVRELLPGTRPILQWFFQHQRADGFLQNLPWWTVVDRVPEAKPFPRADAQGRSALVTLLFVEALQRAAEMEDRLGSKTLAQRYRADAVRTAAAVNRMCWDAQKGLLADTPQRNSFSQHANIFAILTGTLPPVQRQQVMKHILAAQFDRTLEPQLSRVTFHIQFYLARAMEKTGFADQYVKSLTPWRNMLAMGLTSTPEFPEPSRTDTHAWSAHPIYDLLTIVAGIHPASPGFRTVSIEPHPGGLTHFSATMPHPAGDIRVDLQSQEKTVTFHVTLPAGLTGRFRWKERAYPLHSGEQTIEVAE